VPAQRSFDYAVVRVVPRVEREEFLNAGVILYCAEADWLGARVELLPERLGVLAPEIDLALVASHLGAIPRIAAGAPDAGPIGKLSRRERWHWLVAPRSTIIQVSPVHAGLCRDPAQALEHLLERMVRPPAPPDPASAS